MAKKIITKFEEPLSDSERKEIVEILKPAYIQSEKISVARELQRRILNEFVTHLGAVGPNYHLNEIGKHFSHGHLNSKLKEITDEWYGKYAVRLGSDILPDDIFVKVSEDGLFVLTYSDTVKEIIADHDFELETVAFDLPSEDYELIRQVNGHLEKEPLEE